MIKDSFDIIEKVREKWEYPYAIIVLEGLILVVSLFIWNALNNNYILTIIPICMLAALVFWLYSNRIEKPKFKRFEYSKCFSLHIPLSQNRP